MAVYVELVSAPRGGWLWHIIVVHWIKAFKAINQSAYLPNPDPQPINIYQSLFLWKFSLFFSFLLFQQPTHALAEKVLRLQFIKWLLYKEEVKEWDTSAP